MFMLSKRCRKFEKVQKKKALGQSNSEREGADKALDKLKRCRKKPLTKHRKRCREKATEKVYHDIGRLKKEFRNKTKPIVLIAGCVAQAEGEILLKKENYIDAVVGPQSYHQINDIISKVEKKTQKVKTLLIILGKFNKE